MDPNPRQLELLAAVQRLGPLSVEALAERFGVTLQTVRRDVALLAGAGLLTRFHGGVRMPHSTVENIAYRQRQQLNDSAKQCIARSVARRVPNDCSIFVNIGTTTEAIARALLRHQGLRVITNNLNVAAILSDNPACEVIVAGGVVRPRDRGIVGEATVDFIKQFKVDIGLIGISGIEADGTLRDYDYREVNVARAIVGQSREVWLAADHTKFNRPAMVELARLDQVHRLFTDVEPPAPFPALLADAGVRWVDCSTEEPGFMNPTFILALDQGTSSSRSIVFDAAGQIVAMAQREVRQIYPQPGWVEHDPKDIWTGQLATAREALAKAGVTAGQIAAIGITNQRETTIVWDRTTGEPIYNAIVWQDRRAEPTCVQLREAGHEALFKSRTGLVLDAYFSGTKLKWILDHVPGARAAAGRGELAFGTVDAWLLWQLTGGRLHATDVSNASRTLLFDVHRNAWDDELLQRLDVPRSVLPQVHPSSHAFGRTQPDLFGAEIAIGGVAGDQQSALFGQACFTPGLAKNTYGTGCFMLMHTGSRFQASTNGLLTTSAAQTTATPEFALEGSVFIGGAVVQWLRDGLRAIQGSGEVQRLAESVPDSGGVMFVPAFTGLGAPYWDADARGAIVGLTRGSTVAHIARAALESIAFQSAALLQAMSRDAAAADASQPSGQPHYGGVTELRVDGGACVNDLLMQFQADLLGLPVVRPKVIETTALGAAYLAGLSCGVWDGLATLGAQWQAERTFYPTLSRERAQALMANWERAVRQAVAR